MGSFDVVCFLTRKTIHGGDEVAVFPLKKNKYWESSNTIYSPYVISHPPIFGSYFDYGYFELSAEQLNYWELEETEDFCSYVSDGGEKPFDFDDYMYCLKGAWDHFSTHDYGSDWGNPNTRSKKNAHLKVGKEIHKELPYPKADCDDSSPLYFFMEKDVTDHYGRHFTKTLICNPFSGKLERIFNGDFIELVGQLHLFETFRYASNVHIMPAKQGCQHGSTKHEFALAKFSYELCRQEKCNWKEY